MASRYTVYYTTEPYGFESNDPDTTFVAKYAGTSTNVNRSRFLNGLQQLPKCALELDSIESGRVIVSRVSTEIINIILFDNVHQQYLFYFTERTGRLFNDNTEDVEEYYISLNYYSTFLEPLIIDAINNPTGWHLFSNLRVRKSNLLPKFWTANNSNSMYLTGPVSNTQYTWFQDSVKTLPEDLDVEGNNKQWLLEYKNIFDATWAYNSKNFTFKQCSFTLTQFGVTTSNSYGLRIQDITIMPPSSTGWSNLQLQCLYMERDNETMVGSTWIPSSRARERVQEFVNTCDTDTWALYSVVGTLMYAGQPVTTWYDGTGEAGTQQALIVAFPVGPGSRYSSAIHLIERFSNRRDKGMGYLGTFRLKANNFFRNGQPTGVLLVGCKGMDVGCAGNQKGHTIIGFVLSGFGNRAMPNVPDHELGWYTWSNVNIDYVIKQYYRVGAALTTRITTAQELIKTSLFANGNLMLNVVNDDRWINYDYTKWYNGYGLQVNYTMMGYEMTWCMPKTPQGSSDWRTNSAPLEPWRTNVFSEGLNLVKSCNLGRFDNSAQTTLNANAQQWQIGQSQANYEYNTQRQIRKNQFWNEMKTGLPRYIATIGGLTDIIDPRPSKNAKNKNKFLENQRELDRKWFDTQKLPAVYADAQNDITASYPAGDALWVYNNPINAVFYGWNVPFRVEVINYCNANGWINHLVNWQANYLTQEYASNIFKCTQFDEVNMNTYSITPQYSVACVAFVQDHTQVSHNMGRVATKVPLQYRKWITNVLEKGLRIRFDAVATRSSDNVIRLGEIDWNKAIECGSLPPQKEVSYGPVKANENQQESASENIQGDAQGAGKSRTKTEARSKSRARTGSRKSQTNN